MNNIQNVVAILSGIVIVFWSAAFGLSISQITINNDWVYLYITIIAFIGFCGICYKIHLAIISISQNSRHL